MNIIEESKKKEHLFIKKIKITEYSNLIEESRRKDSLYTSKDTPIKKNKTYTEIKDGLPEVLKGSGHDDLLDDYEFRE